LYTYEILKSRVYSVKAYLWLSSDRAFNTVDKAKAFRSTGSLLADYLGREQAR